ncbi:TPA: hypothetical protein JA361_14250 [Legionella pneumophila]|nr:hypothetical protein [Legionella pneumophila]HAT8182563.1 hypothetical protein [Legionella pneumophila]
MHAKRLQAVMDPACSLQKKQNLSLTGIVKVLLGESSVKNNIKKVDRLERNKHLYEEITRNKASNMHVKQSNLALFYGRFSPNILFNSLILFI